MQFQKNGPKKWAKSNPSNYRPILLLPLISKITEKLIHEKASSFLSNNEILYNYQSGFRKNHSIDLCLMFLHETILKGLDKGLMNGMILIDLQKAFDTIDHNILSKKNECYSFLKLYYWLVQIIPLKSIV